MDCYAAAAGGLQPPQQGLRRVAQVGRAEGMQPPRGDVGVVVLGPGVQARQGQSARGDEGRQLLHPLDVTSTDDVGDRHGVVAGVLGVRGADVGVGVDPDDGQVVSVTGGELGEGDDGNSAVPAQGEDPGSVVPSDRLAGVTNPGQDLGTRLHAVSDENLLASGFIADGDDLRGTGVLGQERREHPGSQCVDAPRLPVGQLGQQAAHRGLSRPLPLGPDEAKGVGLGEGGACVNHLSAPERGSLPNFSLRSRAVHHLTQS